MKVWKDTKIKGNLDVEGEIRVDMGGYLVNIKDLFKPKVYASKNMLGTAGWYRIAKVNGSYSGFVHVHQNYNNNMPTMTTLLFQIIYVNGRIKNLSTVSTRSNLTSGSETAAGITGARITMESGANYVDAVYYLEIYYNRAETNNLFANIDGYIGNSGSGTVRNAIEPMNFEPTNPSATVLTEITITNG